MFFSIGGKDQELARMDGGSGEMAGMRNMAGMRKMPGLRVEPAEVRKPIIIRSQFHECQRNNQVLLPRSMASSSIPRTRRGTWKRKTDFRNVSPFIGWLPGECSQGIQR